MFCKYCGSEVKDSTKFCPNCGANLTVDDSYENTTQPNRTETTNNQSTSDAIAVVAYITWIGFIIALIMNTNSNNDFVKYHLNQALILHIFAFLGMIPAIGFIFGIATFVLWIIGIINASRGEEKPLPIIGGIKIL